jgi:hypothetical protein
MTLSMAFLGGHLTRVQHCAQKPFFLGLLNGIKCTADHTDHMCQAKEGFPRKSLDANLPTLS